MGQEVYSFEIQGSYSYEHLRKLLENLVLGKMDMAKLGMSAEGEG